MNDITEKTIQEIINEIKSGYSLDNKNIFVVKKYIRYFTNRTISK